MRNTILNIETFIEEQEEIMRNNPTNSKEYKNAYQKIWYINNKQKKKEQAAKRYRENTEVYLARNKKWAEKNKEKIKEISKEYREVNKEKIREHGKEYRERTKDHIKERAKIYREENKEKMRERAKRYREENREKIKIKDQRWYSERGGKTKIKKYFVEHQEYLKLRAKERHQTNMKIFYDILGNKCAFCGKTDPIVFTIDHINNDGKEERKTLGGTQILAIHLKKMGWPEDYIKSRYQILCYNCNYSKTRRDYLVAPPESLTDKKRKELRLWQEAYKFFGNCEICGESNLKYLTIDHRNGNGNFKRKVENEPGGTQLIRKFEIDGWPESLREEYRILCYNCNCGRQRLRPVYALPAATQPV